MKCPHCQAAVPRSILLGSDQKHFRCAACNVVLEIEDTHASRTILIAMGFPTLLVGALKSGELSWPVAIGIWLGLAALGFAIAYRFGRARVLRIPANLRDPNRS